LPGTTSKDTVKKKRKRLIFPFGIKLALIVTLILLGSIWTITTLVSLMVSSEFVRTAGDTNFDINSRAAAGIRERFYKVRSETLMLLDLDAALANDPSNVRLARNIFFERNPYIAAIIIPGVNEIINRPYISQNGIRLEMLSSWLEQKNDLLEKVKAGVPALLNASPELGTSLLALFYPWHGTGKEEAAVVFFYPQSLLEITGSGSNYTRMTNSDGDILVSPDFSQIIEGLNIKNSPLFEALIKASGESVRLSYTEGNSRFAGAGHLISFTDAAVFSSLEHSLINEQVVAVTRRNMLLSISVIFLTILIIWFFSQTITNPMRKLISATSVIEGGQFELDLKTKSQDELGVLTKRFVEMGQGLNKWVRVKTLVGRFNDQEISGKAMANGIKLDGEYLQVAVLSADFISLADTFSHNNPEKDRSEEAEDALILLNDFITKVADIIKRDGGVIDKISGHRLIGLWGFPVSTEGVTADMMNCIHSAISIRTMLQELNTERETNGETPLRIGCGIQTGEVLAGRMGPSWAYEYSIAGKITDEAVKAGDACVPARTDIVITKAVRDLAGKKILSEKLPQQGDLKVFGLVNLTPSGEHEKQHFPFTLEDVRKSLGIKNKE